MHNSLYGLLSGALQCLGAFPTFTYFVLLGSNKNYKINLNLLIENIPNIGFFYYHYPLLDYVRTYIRACFIWLIIFVKTILKPFNYNASYKHCFSFFLILSSLTWRESIKRILIFFSSSVCHFSTKLSGILICMASKEEVLSHLDLPLVLPGTLAWALLQNYISQVL